MRAFARLVFPRENEAFARFVFAWVMLVVAAVECPACGMKATIVLHYGPAASPEEVEVLRHLERAAPS